MSSSWRFSLSVAKNQFNRSLLAGIQVAKLPGRDVRRLHYSGRYELAWRNSNPRGESHEAVQGEPLAPLLDVRDGRSAEGHPPSQSGLCEASSLSRFPQPASHLLVQRLHVNQHALTAPTVSTLPTVGALDLTTHQAPIVLTSQMLGASGAAIVPGLEEESWRSS